MSAHPLIELIQSSPDDLEAERASLVKQRSAIDKGIAFIDTLLAEAGAVVQPQAPDREPSNGQRHTEPDVPDTTRLILRHDGRLPRNRDTKGLRMAVLRWAVGRERAVFGIQDALDELLRRRHVEADYSRTNVETLLGRMASAGLLVKVDPHGRYRAPYLEEVEAEPERFAQILPLLSEEAPQTS